MATGQIVIDLTDTPSPPPAATLTTLLQPTFTNGHAPAYKLPIPQDVDGSAAKRRRISQALPHVSRAVGGLSEIDFKVQEIAVHALAILADPSDASGPFADDKTTASRAESIVRKLSSLPKYQVRPVSRAPTRTPAVPSRSPTETPRPVSTVARQGQPSRRGRSLAWKGKRELNPSTLDSWFSIRPRPYRSVAERCAIARGSKQRDNSSIELGSAPYHVDFTREEVGRIVACVSKYLPQSVPQTVESLTRLSYQHNIPTFVGNSIQHRTPEDVRNFCSDLLAGKASHPDQGRVISLERSHESASAREEGRRLGRVASLLLARETEGNRGFGRMRQYDNFQTEFRNAQEDSITLIAEYTNCAGDIATTTWIPDSNIICGTTNHSDAHNQQYNKPGNLLLCSTSRGELRAFADHRIPRPIVEKGDNSTEAMRASQDPWLYSSVVSSDYDESWDLAYTSSFDKTVKVWKVCKKGRSMTALATWHFEGNVNFVCASRDGSGRVATAADVPSHAVRIYTVDRENIQNSRYISFSCSRTDADGSGKWAYFPATMQWGRSPGTMHILAVGYSPRALTGYDHDIPEDKTNSGEVTLWDADRGCRLHVTTATTSNFFEIVWHPRQQCFIAATAPVGPKNERGVRTQIHLFRRDNDRADGGYKEYQSLDCCASDINELTLMPNSLQHAYVAAGCTDGNVYVWDTAQGDKPIHVLRHGHPVDECHEDREKEDTGVKFTAWGITPDRFYTGSSDGVVKVWNIRKRRKPFIRDLLVAPGPISCGAFSPDSKRLVIGDATGRVFVFSLNKNDTSEKHYVTMPGTGRRVCRPIPFITHPEPPPPQHSDAMHLDDESAAAEARRTYLDTKRLVLHPNPVIGAVQGPKYAATKLFRRDAHLNDDPRLPLLPSYERLQRASVGGPRSRLIRRLRRAAVSVADEARHEVNLSMDFDAARLAGDVVDDLVGGGAALWVQDEDWGFEYEEMPDVY